MKAHYFFDCAQEFQNENTMIGIDSISTRTFTSQHLLSVFNLITTLQLYAGKLPSFKLSVRYSQCRLEVINKHCKQSSWYKKDLRPSCRLCILRDAQPTDQKLRAGHWPPAQAPGETINMRDRRPEISQFAVYSSVWITLTIHHYIASHAYKSSAERKMYFSYGKKDIYIKFVVFLVLQINVSKCIWIQKMYLQATHLSHLYENTHYLSTSLAPCAWH